VVSENTSKGSDIERRYTAGNGERAGVEADEVLKDIMIAMRQSCHLTVGGRFVWLACLLLLNTVSGSHKAIVPTPSQYLILHLPQISDLASILGMHVTRAAAMA